MKQQNYFDGPALFRLGIIFITIVLVTIASLIILQPATASPDLYEEGRPYIHKFGENDDIDTAAAEDIWDVGGNYSFPTSAAETTIVSASANDTAAGTGARTVTVEGLDANYYRLTETATMNGTNVVTLTGQFLRVYRAYVVTAGSGGINAGNIQVKHGATVLAQITADVGQTLMSIYTIPANYSRGELCRSFASVAKFGAASTTVATLTLMARAEGGAWQTKDVATIQRGAPPWDYDYGDCLNFAPKTDIKWRATAVTANDTAIIATFDIRLVP